MGNADFHKWLLLTNQQRQIAWFYLNHNGLTVTSLNVYLKCLGVTALTDVKQALNVILLTLISLRRSSTSVTAWPWLGWQRAKQQYWHTAVCSASQWYSLYLSCWRQVQAFTASASTNRCPRAEHGCCRCVCTWDWQHGALQRRQTFTAGSGGPRRHKMQCSAGPVVFSTLRALYFSTILDSLWFFSRLGFCVYAWLHSGQRASEESLAQASLMQPRQKLCLQGSWMGSENTCRQMGQMSSSSKQFLHVSAMSEAIMVWAVTHWLCSTSARPQGLCLSKKKKKKKVLRRFKEKKCPEISVCFFHSLLTESDESPWQMMSIVYCCSMKANSRRLTGESYWLGWQHLGDFNTHGTGWHYSDYSKHFSLL